MSRMCSANGGGPEGIDSSFSSKRKAFEILSQIFRKKSRDKDVADAMICSNYSDVGSDHFSPVNANALSQSMPNSLHGDAIPGNNGCYQFPTKSPVSPRVKNINEDMGLLTLSRQDNPYITQKLEKISSSGDFLSCADLTISVSPQGDCYGSEHGSDGGLGQGHDASHSPLITIDLGEIAELDDNGANLHEHLIRSPPPCFPQTLSHFVFPGPGIASPIHSISHISRKRHSQVSTPSKRVSQHDPQQTINGDAPNRVPLKQRNSIALGENYESPKSNGREEHEGDKVIEGSSPPLSAEGRPHPDPLYHGHQCNIDIHVTPNNPPRQHLGRCPTHVSSSREALITECSFSNDVHDLTA